MPRSLKVIITCDNCDEEIDATEPDMHEGALVLTINGNGPKQIDLCSACLRGDRNYLYVIGLFALFDQADTIPQAKPVKRNTNGGASTCPACGHTSPSAQGMGRHTRAEHGMGLADLRTAIEKGNFHG